MVCRAAWKSTRDARDSTTVRRGAWTLPAPGTTVRRRGHGYPVVSTAPPGSPPTSIRYAYAPYNAQILVSTTDRANLTTRYGYDQRFQRASELSSWGALTTYRTDELGRQTAVTNALNEVTQSVFDQFDQLVATIYADHIPITQERIEYRAYDEFGKMTIHWGAATYDVAYAYDPAGNQVSLTDGNGNTTRWEYDGRNRKVRKVYADNSDYAYGYDASGNQNRKRDAAADHPLRIQRLQPPRPHGLSE